MYNGKDTNRVAFVSRFCSRISASVRLPRSSFPKRFHFGFGTWAISRSFDRTGDSGLISKARVVDQQSREQKSKKQAVTEGGKGERTHLGKRSHRSSVGARSAEPEEDDAMNATSRVTHVAAREMAADIKIDRKSRYIIETFFSGHALAGLLRFIDFPRARI
ncbi:hypothetical protein KM043_008771 [Ampulex compressa]|nr:hypothetical protein KM043_008771 [Ampulex compressa]